MIVCCGDALIDMLQRDGEEGSAFFPFAGGALLNSAVALGRLGERTSFVSGLSGDLFGRMLVEALEHAGVEHDLCPRSQRPTTLAFVTLDNGQAHYTFYDENSAARMIADSELPRSTEARAVLFGAISLAVEPSGSVFEAFAGRMSVRSVIMLDPNVRADFIADAAAYRDRLERMAAMADIIKISAEDIAWMYPQSAVEDCASRWLEGRTALVCLTRGAEGAVSYTRRGTLSISGEPAKVVDTVGAGDSFNAGLLCALRRRGLLSRDKLSTASDEDLLAGLRFASRVAAITVSRAGANPPWLEELDA